MTPETDPSRWFLSEAEIQSARGGRGPKRSLSVMTSGNRVEPLIDGEDMMARLQMDLVAARSGDFIHFTAWRMDKDLELVPGSGLSVGKLWRQAMERGAITYTLLYDAQALNGNVAPADEDTFSFLQNALLETYREGGVALDDRFPRFGSHHQKTAIFGGREPAVAYCGGIDPAGDRWDTRAHDMPKRPFRERSGFIPYESTGVVRAQARRSFPGWHDAHVRLRGPAVLDIERNFRERWNDYRPAQGTQRAYLLGPEPRVEASPGTHHVQVLRTFACGGLYPSFAPHGEFTCFRGYLKAIAAARRYIYLEDQYLWFDEIAAAIADVLPRIEKVVIVVPPESEIPLGDFRQGRFIRILQSIAKDKVHVFRLARPRSDDQIYVHSKLLIIDDVYAVIGSPNITQRSMTHDTEIAVAVVDAQVEDGACRFARELRMDVWGEHLGLAPADRGVLRDPVRALRVWEDQARSGVAYRVRPQPPPCGVNLRRTFHLAFDPNGRCERPKRVHEGIDAACEARRPLHSGRNV